MHLLHVGAFEAEHACLPWPWVAVAPSAKVLAFVSQGSVRTRIFDGRSLAEGPSFVLPPGLALPTSDAPDAEGLRGLAPSHDGAHVALVGVAEGESVVTLLDARAVVRHAPVAKLAGPGLSARAVTFDRTGENLWIACEGPSSMALVLVDARTFDVRGVVPSAKLPAPATIELFVHPQDDAVLALAACGQDGTFARVAGFAGGPPEAIPTALDEGGIPAGMVGFSADGARVHLVEADELRTHAWPTLHELSSVELVDDVVSAYSGVVLGDRVLVDAHDADDGTLDLVVAFDRTALVGRLERPPFPRGMWVGRLGADALVTVDASGDPARGEVVRLPAKPG